jgi:3-hydroxymyristoyl/3-hydroxydecanoyl-(acyl carrier protein) dehydratase
VQFDWVMQVIAAWIGGFPQLARIEALKFKKPIAPGETLTLRLERDANAMVFRFRLAEGDVVFSEGRIVLHPEPGSEE